MKWGEWETERAETGGRKGRRVEGTHGLADGSQRVFIFPVFSGTLFQFSQLAISPLKKPLRKRKKDSDTIESNLSFQIHITFFCFQGFWVDPLKAFMSKRALKLTFVARRRIFFYYYVRNEFFQEQFSM